MKNYLIKNAKVWTADEQRPWADCIVIKGKRIDYVGPYNEKLAEDDVDEVDAGGKLIIPAFLDSHTHIVSAAKTLWCLLLEQREYQSIDEIMEIVKEYALEYPKEEVPYIYAYSCPTHLMDAEYADRYFMDKYVSDRPVLLCDMNFHRCLLNSKMLELMEIDETVPYDPSTSCNYERFEGNVPNGIVEERAFEFRHDIDKMYEKLNWEPPSEADPETLAPILERFTDYGVCGILDGFTESEDVFAGLRELKNQGRLNHYYHGMPLMNNFSDLEETIRTAKEWHDKYADDYIYVDTIKYFLDGTNELGTGAVIEPFVHDPHNYGKMNMSEDQLTIVFERLNQENINIQIHLVGDRAFRASLNAVEHARKNENEKGRAFSIRVTLLHCELTHPDDRRRAAELGVYINFTPAWAGGFFGDGAKQYLGEKRYNSMYAFNEMIESGAVVNYSSDIVDEEGLPLANPVLGIQIGHTRTDPQRPGQIREPASECISVENLMRGYTINNALGMGFADKTGSLTPGKMANLCILSDNIFECKPEDISKIKADIVIFEGKTVKGAL
ncbi:amidohydrolase family protein [Anaerovorax odorimutans]|uniref:Amidohydrolase family protein n=1 Tax=Anaerovorax odorimutans TaxID=109327 RepID=A0ABT1RNG1_9FIRM|nr:amidohydrolase family protein [Anaerovorax odorimutans]MCQ4636726.1 amidohydrolase family protein [Anaerovorax odorimutans]